MSRVRRPAQVLSLGAVAFLVAFHGWLFAERLVGGELLEPVVALRWLASLVLIAALRALRRAGVPLIRGRRALVFWVLVALLHWSASPMAERGLAAGELLVAAPGAITLAGGVWLLLGGTPRRLRTDRPPRHAGPPAATHVPPLAPWLLLALAPRPPPR